MKDEKKKKDKPEVKPEDEPKEKPNRYSVKKEEFQYRHFTKH